MQRKRKEIWGGQGNDSDNSIMIKLPFRKIDTWCLSHKMNGRENTAPFVSWKVYTSKRCVGKVNIVSSVPE